MVFVGREELWLAFLSKVGGKGEGNGHERKCHPKCDRCYCTMSDIPTVTMDNSGIAQRLQHASINRCQ